LLKYQHPRLGGPQFPIVTAVNSWRAIHTDLQLSHAELRAAIILAGKEIKRLNFGKSDTPLLRLLRRTLRDARRVAQQEGITVRVNLKLK